MSRRLPTGRLLIAMAVGGMLTASVVALFVFPRSTPLPPIPSAPASPPTTAAPRPLLVGISTGAVTEHLTASRLRSEFEAMRRAGARAVRLDIFWPDAESALGQYNFSAFDREIGAARAAGLQVLAILDYPAGWSKDPVADFSAFAARAAARYGPMGVHDYEIWNEPNIGATWFGNQADPAAYTRLLISASRAIRAVDPHDLIVAGALANVPTTSSDVSAPVFLADMYEDGARGSFDVLSDHPYSWPHLPSMAAGNNFGVVATLHTEMLDAGDPSPVWLDEYGAPTYAGGVSQEQQADEISAAFRLAGSLPWVGALFVYDWQDNSYGPGFGLIDSSGRPKAAYAAFVHGAAASAGR